MNEIFRHFLNENDSKLLNDLTSQLVGFPVMPLYSRPQEAACQCGFRKGKDGSFFLHLEVPGLKAENLDVEFRNGGIQVKGRTPEDPEGFQYAVDRFFPLPEEADATGVQAALNDGVLTLRAPVKPGVVAHKIAIG